jgi:signal transduction histidine kinase
LSFVRRPWVLYALFLTLGLGAMAWITRLALRSDQAEWRAQSRALREEKIRLSLWHMDATMALFLSPEAARPHYHYQTFHREHGVLVPSPMLLVDDPLVLLRFQVDRSGAFSSPLVAEDQHGLLAKGLVKDPKKLDEAHDRLRSVQKSLTWASMSAAMLKRHAVFLSQEQMAELRGRSRRGVGVPMASPFEVNLGTWTPFWSGQDLFLARQVWVGNQESLQAIWLDWPGVKEVLLSAARDQFPEADLVPAEDPDSTSNENQLASLPVIMKPGPMPLAAHLLSRPAKAALIFGWACALLGAVAGAVVLSHTLELSERRGAFASAVTHELRTPLTTFRLYTELLAKGMVPDPEEQAFLLNTLLEEADRLDHLVKNVLAFARLESQREGRHESLTLEALLERPMARLQERAKQGGLEWICTFEEDARGAVVQTDPLLVEQILFNLVDNAAKYATGAQDRRLHLEAEVSRSSVAIRVRDHGPGIDVSDRRHLFRPFHKSVQKAARTAPGVGLGLALCRKLARSMNGDLELDASVQEGTAFRLILPRADDPPQT